MEPLKKSTIVVFWALVATFIMAVSYIFIPIAMPIKIPFWPFFVIPAIISFFLGVTLISLTLKERVKGWSKRFLLLTGISVVGMPISIILHNLIYGLFIHFFGQGFWDRIGQGGDEPFFFIMAIFVCPIAFLIGAIGTIALLTKQRK